MQSSGFWGVLLAMAGFGVLHSLLASHRVKAHARARFGVARYDRWYRLFFNGMALVTFLPVLALVARYPGNPLYTIRIPWLVLTGLIQILSAVAILLTLLQTGGLNFLGLEQVIYPQKAARPRQFVAAGFYRWVRHPLYFFSLVIIWLFPLVTTSILAFNIGATLYLTLGTLFEERKLLQEFGSQYQDYKACTPMFIPVLHRKPPCRHPDGKED